MTAFYCMLTNILLFVLLVVPGYVCGRLKLITRKSLGSLTNLIMYVGMPFLVMSKTMAIRIDSTTVKNMLAAVAAAFAFHLLLFAIAWALNGRAAKSDDDRRAFTFCSLFSNCGFLGIPLAAAVFPDSPDTVLYVSIYNIVCSFLIWTLGVRLLSGKKGAPKPLKALFNPVGIAVLAGVVLSVTGLSEKLSFLQNYADTLASLTTPLAMIILGAELSMLGAVSVAAKPCVYWVGFIRLVLSPAIMTLLLLILNRFLRLGEEFSYGMFIASAVSPAVLSSALAEKYGRSPDKATAITLGTTILSVFSLSVGFYLFQLII